MHPLSNQLTPLIETLEDALPPHYFPLALASPCIIASRDSTYSIPPGLLRRLLSLIPTAISRTPSKDNAVKETGDAQREQKTPHDNKTGTVTKKFLGIPGIPAPNVNVNMDVRKWTWPLSLTFGANGNTVDVKGNAPPERKIAESNDSSSPAKPIVEVNSQALEEALSSETAQQDTNTLEQQSTRTTSDTPKEDGDLAIPRTTVVLSTIEKDDPEPDAPSNGTEPKEELPPPKPPIFFMETRVHLPNNDPLDTHLKIIRYLRVCFLDILCLVTIVKRTYLQHNNLLLALIPSVDADEGAISPELADKCMSVLERIQETITVEQEKM